MIICITGQAGAGKSTAMNALKNAKYNCLIIDEYIHDIYQKDKEGYKSIKANFGSDFVNNNEVDREKLGTLVFNDKKQLDKLNKLMIPLIIKKIKELNKNELWFVELAIYMDHEKDFKKIFDKIILINGSKSRKNSILNEKFNYLRKFSTKGVGNVKNPIQSNTIKADFTVDNILNKKFLENEIKKIAKEL